MSRCSDLEPALSAYVDHEASPSEVALVEAHIRDCADCTRRLATYGEVAPRIEREVRALTFQAPTRLARRQPPSRRRWQTPGFVLLAARVAALVVMLALIGYALVGVLQTGGQVAELATNSNLASSPPSLEQPPHPLVDPTTAYLLFVLGLFAVFVEVAHPGSLVPAIAGVVSLLLALAAFTVLPINALGVALIVGAVVLMAVDVRLLGHGALTLVGVACMVLGSFLFYIHGGSSTSPFATDVTISPPVLVGVAAVGLLLGLGLVRVAREVYARPPVVAMQTLVGARGVARSVLAPEGVVHVNGQLWSARAHSGTLAAGEPIRVVRRNGLVLEVESTVHVGAATRKGLAS